MPSTSRTAPARTLKEVYDNAGKLPLAGWTALPSADVPQTVYKEATVSGAKTFVFDPEASGFMVPPPARDDETDRMMKSPAFLSGVMRPCRRFSSQPTSCRA